MTSPFGFAVNVPKRVPRRGPQDIPAAPFGFAPPPSKMQQTLEILNEYNPLPMFERLMKSPMASGGEITDQNIADGLGITMGLTGASAFAPKPTNALNMGIRAFHGSPHSFDEFVAREAGQNIGAENLSSVSRKGHLYRGMTSEEYNATIARGQGVKSINAHSLPGEGTSFAEDVPTAESYANFGRDDPRKTGKPTYLVEVAGSPAITRKPDGYFHAQGEIMPTRVWEMTSEGGRIVAKQITDLVKKYGIAGASAMLGYNILDGMDPAQADELKRIEGNQ